MGLKEGLLLFEFVILCLLAAIWIRCLLIHRAAVKQAEREYRQLLLSKAADERRIEILEDLVKDLKWELRQLEKGNDE